VDVLGRAVDVWGQEGREFKSGQPRQDDVGLSRLIRAAFIRQPGHPRQAAAPGEAHQLSQPVRAVRSLS
jgi:hypothetical protein